MSWLVGLLIWIASLLAIPPAPAPRSFTVDPRGPIPQIVPYAVFSAALYYFGAEADDAICIARYESQFRPHRDGIMQIIPSNWTAYHTSSEALQDPRESMRVARELRDAAGGWWPWSTASLCGL